MPNKKESAVSDEQIIAALISSGTITEAATAAGISARTIYERMTHKEFKAAYTAAKSDILRHAVFNMDSKLTDAVDTIAEIMQDESTPPATRLQAAQMLIQNAEKCSQRLQSLENDIAKETYKNPFDTFDF
jgi:hypothetical protein